MCVITEHEYSCCNSYQIVKEQCPEAENCRWVHNAGRLHHEQCDGCRLMANFWADFLRPTISDIPTTRALLPQPKLAGLENFGDFAVDSPAPPTPPAEPDKNADQHNDLELQRSHDGGFEDTNVDTKLMSKALDPGKNVRGNSTQASMVQQTGPQPPWRYDSLFSSDGRHPFQYGPPGKDTQTKVDDDNAIHVGSPSAAQGHTQTPPSLPESVRHLRATPARMGAHVVEKPEAEEELPHIREVSGHCMWPKPKPAKRGLDGKGAVRKDTPHVENL